MSDAHPEERLLDARGHRCPVPTLRLRRALEEAPPGGHVRLLADDPMARIDVPHFVANLGAGLGASVLEIIDAPNGVISFLVAKAP